MVKKGRIRSEEKDNLLAGGGVGKLTRKSFPERGTWGKIAKKKKKKGHEMVGRISAFNAKDRHGNAPQTGNSGQTHMNNYGVYKRKKKAGGKGKEVVLSKSRKREFRGWEEYTGRGKKGGGKIQPTKGGDHRKETAPQGKGDGTNLVNLKKKPKEGGEVGHMDPAWLNCNTGEGAWKKEKW